MKMLDRAGIPPDFKLPKEYLIDSKTRERRYYSDSVKEIMDSQRRGENSIDTAIEKINNSDSMAKEIKEEILLELHSAKGDDEKALYYARKLRFDDSAHMTKYIARRAKDINHIFPEGLLSARELVKFRPFIPSGIVDSSINRSIMDFLLYMIAMAKNRFGPHREKIQNACLNVFSEATKDYPSDIFTQYMKKQIVMICQYMPE
jgi:hypothetical protein